MGDLPVLVLPDLLDPDQMVDDPDLLDLDRMVGDPDLLDLDRTVDDLDLLDLDPMVRMVDVVPKLAAVDQKAGEVPKMDLDQMADR